MMQPKRHLKCLIRQTDSKLGFRKNYLEKWKLQKIPGGILRAYYQKKYGCY